jgi:hypothetical protein
MVVAAGAAVTVAAGAGDGDDDDAVLVFSLVFVAVSFNDGQSLVSRFAVAADDWITCADWLVFIIEYEAFELLVFVSCVGCVCCVVVVVVLLVSTCFVWFDVVCVVVVGVGLFVGADDSFIEIGFTDGTLAHGFTGVVVDVLVVVVGADVDVDLGSLLLLLFVVVVVSGFTYNITCFRFQKV